MLSGFPCGWTVENAMRFLMRGLWKNVAPIVCQFHFRNRKRISMIF